MPLLVFEPLYTISRIRAEPNAVFLFGDNNLRKGKKGQAIIRDEPNVLGIRTKWLPSTVAQAYFYDSQLGQTLPLVEHDLDVAEELLRLGTTLYVPVGGIGTGLANLSVNSPALFTYICDRLNQLEQTYNAGFQKLSSNEL